MSEVNSVVNAAGWVELCAAHAEEQEISVATANLWLAGQLPDDDPAADVLFDLPRPDMWGNPYRIPRFPENFNGEIRVYSTGRDGISLTDGHDNDDIRSWDETLSLIHI